MKNLDKYDVHQVDDFQTTQIRIYSTSGEFHSICIWKLDRLTSDTRRDEHAEVESVLDSLDDNERHEIRTGSFRWDETER